MKFSVIIPVYNTEKYLDECLRSILCQTYQEFEVVLMDDGSTDNSVAVCDAYQKRYPDQIRVFHQKNQGQLSARCHAIREATGDYCLFADADDLLTENALETLYSSLKEYNMPDMLVYSFFYEEINGTKMKSKQLFDEGILDPEKVQQLFITDTAMNNVWTKAVKREVARCDGFDFSPYYEIRSSEDMLYSMVVTDRCQSIAYVQQPLYRYRLFDSGTTRNYSVDRIPCFNDAPVYRERVRFADKWGLNSPEWKQRIEANALYNVIHVFDLFYSHASQNDKNKVIEYPWQVFVPEALRDKEITDNPIFVKEYQQLLSWILQHDKRKIKSYYLKKRGYLTFKNIKRKIMKHE